MDLLFDLIATYHEEWIALLSFSAPALKCAMRDQWIGWDYRHQYDLLHLITNNTPTTMES